MENAGIVEDSESKKYTREEVLSIISKYQPTVTDYAIQTYFNIFEITEGDLVERFRRRFNNIILNNLKKIIEEVTVKVFYQKALNILQEELSSTTYVSCIYSHNTKFGFCPVFVQYFNPTYGIEHRLLSFISSPFDLNRVLVKHSLFNKLVGYCGDFLYNDPGISNSATDYFTSLRLLNGSTIRNLPYCDGFIERLFNLLVDYLPENIMGMLIHLGETLLATSTKTPFIQDLVSKYKRWMDNQRKPHLLLTDYTEEVIENFNLLNNYLEPFRCLPRSIELLNSVLHRFLLVFMREMYLKVYEIRLLDNCAVMYFYQLAQIRGLFNLYEETDFIPMKAMSYFQREFDYQMENCNTTEAEMDDLFKEIKKITNACYVRAIHYIDPLLKNFHDFSDFSWVLLQTSAITADEVHASYHIVHHNTSCSQCSELMKEVKRLNTFLSNFSLVEMQDSVVLKWVIILKNCHSLSMIRRVLKYLFALPASHNLFDVIEDGSEYCFRKKAINFNWRKLKHEEVINNLEGFLGEEYLDLARIIVEKNQITTFID